MTVYPHFSSVSSHHATLPPTLCRTCHCKPSDTLQVSSLQLSACPLILVPSDCLKGALLSWLRLYPTMRFSLSLPATALGACLLSKVHLECQARAVLLIWIQWSFGICFSNGICNFLNQRPLIQGFQYAEKWIPPEEGWVMMFSLLTWMNDHRRPNRSGSEVKKQEILKLLVTCVQSGTEESNQALDPEVVHVEMTRIQEHKPVVLSCWSVDHCSMETSLVSPHKTCRLASLRIAILPSSWNWAVWLNRW